LHLESPLLKFLELTPGYERSGNHTLNYLHCSTNVNHVIEAKGKAR